MVSCQQRTAPLPGAMFANVNVTLRRQMVTTSRNICNIVLTLIDAIPRHRAYS